MKLITSLPSKCLLLMTPKTLIMTRGIVKACNFRFQIACVSLSCCLYSCANSTPSSNSDKNNEEKIQPTSVKSTQEITDQVASALRDKINKSINGTIDLGNEIEKLCRLYRESNEKWPNSFTELMDWAHNASVKTSIDKSTFKEVEFNQIGSGMEIKYITSSGLICKKKFSLTPHPDSIKF